MSESKHGGSAHHDKRPYWKTAHRDWRVWVTVGLMLGAMAMYVMSDDLGLRLRPQPAPASRAAGQ
jgi:hypothetical protein